MQQQKRRFAKRVYRPATTTTTTIYRKRAQMSSSSSESDSSSSSSCSSSSSGDDTTTRKHGATSRKTTGLFERYASQFQRDSRTTTLPSIESNSLDRQEMTSESIERRLPDSFSSESLLRSIGEQRHWLLEHIESDCRVLKDQRLITVGDLRMLTKSSWKEIPLLPLVKDCLREKIRESLGRVTPSSIITNTGPNTIEPTLCLENESTMRLQSTYVRSAEVSSSTSSSRCLVVSDSGRRYEIDRYCPHKGADLSKAKIKNNILTCPRHKWNFDLNNGGVCWEEMATINACETPNW